MKRFGKYLILGVGGFIIVGLLAIGSYGAIRSINGLAVAQTGTLWNNLKDAAFGDNATKGVMVVSPYVFDGTNFDRARGDIANGFDVDVTRLNDGGNIISVDDGGGSLTVDGVFVGSITPTDNFTNPTDASNSNSLNSEFDGTTWDRIHHSFVLVTGSISANGSGTTVNTTTTPTSKYTMSIDRSAGATNIVEVDLECGIQGFFVQIATITDLTNEPVLVSVDGVPCQVFRYNVVTIGAGNTLTVEIMGMR